jgi:hypothetical protein
MFTKPESITMQLSGINDDFARKTAAQVLRRQKGVKTATVDQSAVAAVTYRADQTTVDTLTAALAQAGYPVI